MEAGDLGLGGIDRLREDVRDLLFLRLGAGGQRGLGAEAVDEALEVGDLALLVLEGGELLHFVGFALPEEIVIVSLPAPQAFPAQFEHSRAQRVEKRPVVRDHEHGAGVTGEEALEPQQCLEIEVVRRLVEHQEVG